MKQAAQWDYEMRFKDRGYQTIAGIDEVGRGCWAGPLVAVAYSFTSIPTTITLFDSKVTTPLQRETLVQQLSSLGTHGVGEVSPQEIDSLGLQAAQYQAYERALAALPRPADFLLLDGRPWKDSPLPHEAIIDGDALVASIAAASIMAKHYRDTLMQTTVHNHYPNYGFASHVGYGTKAHQAAIAQYGVLPIHRTSFKPVQILALKSKTV